MSYGYNQGGYGQSNPYDQRTDYGGYDNYNTQGGRDVEMQPLNDQNPFASKDDPNAVLNECQDIDRAVDELESRLQSLRQQQDDFLNDRGSERQVSRMGDDIMDAYRALGQRLKKVKSRHDSGSPRNAPQVGRVDRRLKKAINEYQKVESDFRRRMQEQQARQYRIVRPDASEEEVRQACEEPNQQIFSQALMQSDRRGQAQSTLNAVRDRHNAIQKIEQQMIELAQLFQDLDQIVQEQEPMVENIEMKGEEVHDNMVKANVEMTGAVDKARSARRKKWWCFWISVLILIIIIVVVVVVVLINRK
ncbi:t-SNARE [Patellaria atrata CBS 101060]|uniref:t-SNARE n=1 Tax=Patellaria atrata CBS 101060 TaxID=1346257 RepID=A0A9P4VM53_9PEZI|nr:t-SNARE [Patellaria atrata CBS 101060]